MDRSSAGASGEGVTGGEPNLRRLGKEGEHRSQRIHLRARNGTNNADAVMVSTPERGGFHLSLADQGVVGGSTGSTANHCSADDKSEKEFD